MVARGCGRKAECVQDPGQPVGVGAAGCHQAHVVAAGLPESDAFAQGMPEIFVAALVQQLGAQAGVGLRRHPDARCGRPVGSRGGRHLHRAQFQARPSGKREACLFLVEQELLRIKGEPMLGPAMQGALAHAGETAPRLFQDSHRILNHHVGLRRKVVEERAKAGMKDGNQRLAAEEILAALDLLK